MNLNMKEIKINFSYWEKFDKLYHLLCVIMTFSLIAYSLNYFAKDKDFSFVEYKFYNKGPEYLYPSISLYFHYPFYDNELGKYGIDSYTYASFLRGNFSDTAMKQILYENVTVNIVKNLIGIKITYSNYTTKLLNRNELFFDNAWKFPYVSYKSAHGKAITMDVAYIKGLSILSIEIVLRKEIFPNKRRPHRMINEPKSNHLIDGFEVLFHLPGQFLLGNARGLGKWNWPKLDKHNENKNITMKFTIRNVDMLKLRNKRNDFCYENFIDHDQTVFDKIMEKAKCRPYYLQTENGLPFCESNDLRKNFINSPNDVITKFDPPCQSITKVQFEYEDLYDGEYEFSENVDEIIIIGIDIMDQLFNQIEQTSAYNIDNLVGDIGGYFGLFLGYAISQIPSTLLMLVNIIKNLIKRKKIRNKIIEDHEKDNSSKKDMYEALIDNCMKDIRVIVAKEIHKMNLQPCRRKT